MKKALLVSLCLVVSGCGTIHSYVPQQTSAPIDAAKFEADLNYCRSDATRRQKEAIKGSHMRAVGMGSLGATGFLVDKATQPKDDYNTSPLEMIDQCMADLGHPVIVKERAF